MKKHADKSLQKISACFSQSIQIKLISTGRKYRPSRYFVPVWNCGPDHSSWSDRTNGYYPSTTECSMVINTDNIVEKPSSFDCSIDFKKTENEDEIIFEIFKDNNNIGSCFVSIFETCGCIHNVEINEAFRGNGYSKLLLQYSLYDIKNICQNILLHVTKENVPAYNLYKKLNFITTSEIIYYDNL